MKHQVTRLVMEDGLLASFTGQRWVRQSQSVVSGKGLREAWPLGSQGPECLQGRVTLLGTSSSLLVTSSLKHAPGPLLRHSGVHGGLHGRDTSAQ